MKKTAEAKRTNGDSASGATPSSSKPGRRNWRPWMFLLLCLVGSGIVSFVVFRYLAPSIPRELVGVWEVKEGDLRGATLELRWYGAGVATMHKDGKKLIVNSTVKVDEKKILLTSNDERGKPDTVVQTILKLTDDELVIRDMDQNTYRMVRVSN